MNETLQTIASRYSCRAYEDRLPGRDQLEAIATAALQAPSAMNRQPWEVVVITDKALIDEMDAEGMRLLSEGDDKAAYDRFMARGGKLFYNAPCMFLILKQPGADLDCGIVSQNIALAASSLGLGNVICGMAGIPFQGPKGEYFKQKTGFHDDWVFGMTVLVGHPAAQADAPHSLDTAKVRYI